MPQTQVRVFREANGQIPFVDWLGLLEKRNRKAHEKCLARLKLLALHGNELRRPIADYLRDRIYELRAKCGTVNYRMLYFFTGRNVTVVSHGFTKEGEIPDREIELAIKRLNLIETHPGKHIADFDD